MQTETGQPDERSSNRYVKLRDGYGYKHGGDQITEKVRRTTEKRITRELRSVLGTVTIQFALTATGDICSSEQ